MRENEGVTGVSGMARKWRRQASLLSFCCRSRLRRRNQAFVSVRSGEGLFRLGLPDGCDGSLNKTSIVTIT